MERAKNPTVLKVLLVEDNELDRLSILHALRNGGIQAEITYRLRAEEALEALHRTPGVFDILVTDCNLPGLSGLELGRKLEESNPALPKVILVAAGSERLVSEALKAGFDDYIIKNCGLDYLELLPMILSRTVQENAQRQAFRQVQAGCLVAKARFEHLASCSPAMVFQAAPGKRLEFTFISANCLRLLGYEPAELYRNRALWSARLHPEDAAGFESGFQGISEAGSLNVEFRFRHRDDSYRWLRAEMLLLKDESGEPLEISGSFVDLTGTRELEAALKESERRLALITRKSTDTIYRLDREGRITFISDSIRKYGYSTEELVGASILEIVAPEDREKARYRINERRTGWRSTRDLKLRLLVWTDPSSDSQRVTPDAELEPVFLVDAEGQYESKPPEGSKFIGTAGMARDITAERRLEEARNRALQLESIGILAGGIAHEFNNILTTVLGNITLARLMLDSGDKLDEILSAAEKASFRAKELTQKLLTFARGGAPIKKPTRILELLEESAAFTLRDTGIQFRLAAHENLWPVEVDRGQLGQAFGNLLRNACQAMPGGGEIDIRAENVTIGPQEDSAVPEGHFVRISLKDHGEGIPEENLDKIFEPFFTTWEKGPGLGLPAAYSIIKKHGGQITVESQPGAGATFQIYLPTSSIPAETDREPKKASAGRGARVLLMDDEPLIRDVASRLIQHIGHQVEVARDGREAIELYSQAKQENRPFDVVIMDLTIPGGMGGEEALRKLAELDPGVKAIASSGYSVDPVLADFRNFGFKNIVTKPYNLAELREKLQEVLVSH